MPLFAFPTPDAIMPKFDYKARSHAGAVTSGQIEASDRRAAMRRLQAEGLSPVTLKEAGGKSASSLASFAEKLKTLGGSGRTDKQQDSAPRTGRAKREKVGLAVMKRLMELHGSGLPAGDSIRILSQRLSEKEQKALATALWRDLSEGATLAGAMARHPKYFSGSVSYVIEAGEATGSLAPILRKVIEHLEEKQAIRTKMLASMAYPAFICSVAFGVVILFITVLLPQIQGMLERLGGEMTWSARVLIDGADVLTKFGPIAIVAIVLGMIGLQQWRRSERGRKKSDRWLLRIPLLGKIFYYSDLFQSGSLISTLLESGINTTETLQLTERTIANLELRERFHTSRSEVNEGLSIAQAFRRNQFMPDISVDILTVGEDTGNLGQSMNEVTRGFRDELTRRLGALTNIVSTGALTAAFILVALIAMGIVTSVFQV
ncbi:MAG: type II secretion system F family protein, partial [Opitutales bacterium]